MDDLMEDLWKLHKRNPERNYKRNLARKSEGTLDKLARIWANFGIIALIMSVTTRWKQITMTPRNSTMKKVRIDQMGSTFTVLYHYFLVFIVKRHSSPFEASMGTWVKHAFSDLDVPGSIPGYDFVLYCTKIFHKISYEMIS